MRQLGLEPKRKRACASGRVAGKKRTLISGKSILRPQGKEHMDIEILSVEGKETSTAGQVWLLSRFKRR